VARAGSLARVLPARARFPAMGVKAAAPGGFMSARGTTEPTALRDVILSAQVTCRAPAGTTAARTL